MSFITLIVLSLVIGGGAQWYVNHNLKKFSKVACSLNMTGAQAANYMLSKYGIHDVAVYQGASNNDHYDPRNNSISLGPENYNGTSVTAIATACHEAGHACQFAQGYMPFKARSAMVPAVNFCQRTWMILLLVAIFLNILQLMWVAIIFFAVAVVFQLVTLPVEFNASGRALRYLEEIGLPEAEQSGAGAVLRSCAMTYVAAALVSVLDLLYYLQFLNTDE